MSHILGNNSEQAAPARAIVRGFVVRGAPFVNSAAKFWASLIDEADADYPGCDAVVCELLTDQVLDRDLLFPENALQRELDRRQGLGDFQQALREALAQFDMIGPPGTVHIRLLAGAAEKKACDLPLDCVDADIFPCLLVWLLEWAEISESLWNDPELSGGFEARDRERAINYRVRFELCSRHVSEGLFRRTLTVHYARQAR